jgi:hypothetical protein
MTNSWQRQPDEPNKWYARFETYRLLGSNRSIEQAFQIATSSEKRPGSIWYGNAQRWDWQQRAEAWDESEREQMRAVEAKRRFDARQRRLERIEQLQTQAYTALQSANLPDLTEEFARMLIGSLRALFEAMMRAERLEYGDFVDNAPRETEFSADDLARAQQELERWSQRSNG